MFNIYNIKKIKDSRNGKFSKLLKWSFDKGIAKQISYKEEVELDFVTAHSTSNSPHFYALPT